MSMSLPLPPAHSLAVLASRIDELLFLPANMDAVRGCVYRYLVGTSNGTIGVIANRLPCDPNDPCDFTEESILDEQGCIPPITDEQIVSIFASLHDVYCQGVEKVIPLHDFNDVFSHDLGVQAVAWRATLHGFQNLGDHTLDWFNRLFLRFVRNLQEQVNRSGIQSALSPQAGEAEDCEGERDIRKPSADRQKDILTAIENADTPLTRVDLIRAMRLSSEGSLGRNLAWMVDQNILVNISPRGYWPASKPLPK